MDLLEKLARLEAQVAEVKAAIGNGPCAQYGHEWESYGGCNAGCCDLCNCLVPVYVCKKCGDCDYGENAEAAAIKARCADN